jgi:threonine/homoserine/homoserine lactone efflux protein
MMSNAQVFIVAFIVSYAGSIPPGSINISVMQLSVRGYRSAAISLGLGAVLIEMIYAGTAVRFLQFLKIQESLYFILQIITGIGLIVLGIINFISKNGPHNTASKISIKRRAGFTKGLILGLINPLSIPFWLGVTTYLLDHGLISVDGNQFWWYLIGLASGTYALLGTVDLLGSRFQGIIQHAFLMNKLPGILFSLMGIYYLFMLWRLS